MKKFDLIKYLGTWYEIAKTPNRFEFGMKNVRTEYDLNSDGSMSITNYGDTDFGLRKFIGIAKTTDEDMVLDVSFFPGISSEYRILFVDDYYRVALIKSGEGFFWILSREPELDWEILERLIMLARLYGCNIKELILTPQNKLK